MQSIIVYRNPLEAAIWESMMGGGALIFILVMGIALVGVCTYAAIERAFNRNRLSLVYQYNGAISIAVSVLLALALHFWYMG